MRRTSLALPLRLIATCTIALALARTVLPPDVVPGAWVLLVWLALCIALGLTSGSRLFLPLVLLPLVGHWYRIATGPEYLTAGERFPLIAEGVYYLMVFAALTVGMEVGVRLHRFLLRRLASDGSAVGGTIFAGALLALVLGGWFSIGNWARYSCSRPAQSRCDGSARPS